MRTVIYSEDLEPITVINMPSNLYSALKSGNKVRINVVKQVGGDISGVVDVTPLLGKVGEHDVLYPTTKNEMTALTLRSEFLPGQQATLQYMEKVAYTKGYNKGRKEAA